MVGELETQPLVGPVVLGDDQEAARVLVEAVHDAGPLHAADARQARPAVGDQGVHQGAGRIAGGRMHHQASGLVDDDHVVVLVDDGERDRFSLRHRRLRWRHRDCDCLAGVDALAGIADRAPPDRDFAGEDQRLEAGARELQMRGEHAVEPLAGLRRRHRHSLDVSCHERSER